MRRSWLFLLSWSLGACAPARAPEVGEAPGQPPPAPRTFGEERAFLERFGEIAVLTSDTGGKIAIAPSLQGRVMTSGVADAARSLGWINHAFLEAGNKGTQFDNYGGEDRFWLGPEGGQFGLYFPQGAPFQFASWQTPRDLNEGPWTIASRAADRVSLTRALRVKNHLGTEFEVATERTIKLLSAAEIGAALGGALPAGVESVAFETENRITNAGPSAWTKEHGLLSVWVLGMYAPSADAHVVVPFDPAGPGEIVNDRYFGKVPRGRLSVHPAEGFLSFTCDGALRSKIGLRPERARAALASYSPSARLLTIVQFDRPPGATDYVNSMWEMQKDPYGGDVINSYNDGPTEPGKPSLGGFYEIESSSPAAALAPGAALAHTQRTIHLVGDPAALEPIARRVLGVGLADFAR
jgi:hypothetical protein